MSKTVNILGETPKEQWLNAIMIFEMCLDGNARIVRDGLREMCNGDIECDECNAANWDGECQYIHSANVVVEQTKVFADEMRRLVEGVFDEQG